MKNKNVAGILALLGGMVGVHRFYVGQKGIGVLYFLAFFIGLIVTSATYGEVPLIMAPLAVGLMDAVLFFVMPQNDFDEKYNSKRYQQGSRRQQREEYIKTKDKFGRPPVKKVVDDPYKRLGIEKFREFDYLGAIEAFQRSLKQNYESPSTHFNLACSYSMLELPKDAFFHLEKAVEFGFDAYEKIQKHQALSFLRAHPDFELFVKNEYKMITALPLPQKEEEILELKQTEKIPVVSDKEKTNNLLDQLMQLGELREKGLLSDEEFNAQKQKLLRD